MRRGMTAPGDWTCGQCGFYITDEDTNGNVTDFHSAEGLKEGFCAVRELFHIVQDDTEACGSFVKA